MWKAHVLCSITFFENRAVYETVWKNMVERYRPQMKIWPMRTACWITKTTNIYSEYILHNASPLPQLLNEHASMLRYTYIASFLISGHRLIFILKFLYHLQSSYTTSHSEILQFQEAVFIFSQILLRCCYGSRDIAWSDTCLWYRTSNVEK
jgi:hypothetical protein